jgi:opacity protein-like surface antigen
VGIEMGLDLGLSSKKYTATQYNVNVGGVASDVSILQQAQTPMMLNPSVVFQSGHKKTSLYGRVGLALPLKTQVRQDFMITNRPGTGATETDDYIWTFKSNFSLGFTAALGVQYNFSDNISLWFEGSMLSLAPFLKEGDLEDITVDGQGGYKQQVPTSQWKINYSKSFTAASNDYYNQPAYTQPFSNASFNVGFKFSIGSSHSGKEPTEHGRNFIRKPQGRF